MNAAPGPRHALAAALSAAFLAPVVVLGDPAPPVLLPLPHPVPPEAPRVSGPARSSGANFAVEPNGGSAAAATTSPFAPAGARLPAAGSTLTAPATLNANTSADGLSVTQSGGGRAVTGVVTNASNALSAVKGQTAGSGAGVNGVNSGTSGNSGKFQNTNASSAQPGLVSTHAGTGNAVSGVISNTDFFDTAAVLGQHNLTDGWGIGVEGDGGYVGVSGKGTSYGVLGAVPAGGYGVYGSSGSGSGVYGYSASGAGATAYSGGSSGRAVYGINGSSGWAGYFDSAGGVGLYARTGNPSGSYAGVFVGPVYVSGTVYATSYGSSSDRAVKQDFRDIDSDDILQRIETMPIGGWDFQAAPGIHHVGPMAQDFRAAFGLGADDKHIDLTDGLGVSLAAIQALKRQLDAEEAGNAALRARVAELEAQASEQRRAVDARIAALEQAVTAASSATAHP